MVIHLVYGMEVQLVFVTYIVFIQTKLYRKVSRNILYLKVH